MGQLFKLKIAEMMGGVVAFLVDTFDDRWQDKVTESLLTFLQSATCLKIITKPLIFALLSKRKWNFVNESMTLRHSF